MPFRLPFKLIAPQNGANPALDGPARDRVRSAAGALVLGRVVALKVVAVASRDEIGAALHVVQIGARGGAAAIVVLRDAAARGPAFLGLARTALGLGRALPPARWRWPAIGALVHALRPCGIQLRRTALVFRGTGRGDEDEGKEHDGGEHGCLHCRCPGVAKIKIEEGLLLVELVVVERILFAELTKHP